MGRDGWRGGTTLDRRDSVVNGRSSDVSPKYVARCVEFCDLFIGIKEVLRDRTVDGFSRTASQRVVIISHCRGAASGYRRRHKAIFAVKGVGLGARRG